MGLTYNSTGRNAERTRRNKKSTACSAVIALAGNPNVGKSTLFNNLTGMNQHTGNWPGKTVATAEGYVSSGDSTYLLVDLPGTYSLFAHSPEEEVARDFICFGREGEPPDATVVVCDATCLERNLNLVLQTMEISRRTVVCINLMDEAKRKGIEIDTELISQRLGVPVVGVTARKKRSLGEFMRTLDAALRSPARCTHDLVVYSNEVEKAVAIAEAALTRMQSKTVYGYNTRWLSLRLLENGIDFIEKSHEFLDLSDENALKSALDASWTLLRDAGYDREKLSGEIASAIVERSEEICRDAVKVRTFGDEERAFCCQSSLGAGYSPTDRKLDRLLTGKAVGYPVMILLLALVFWITIVGANYPSELLSHLFGYIETALSDLLIYIGAPGWLRGALVSGVFRVLAWVVAVMLPPMAIFFPLFTLLEDSGYLPRIAYNLDRPFCRCHACGKQALTMCMGFGCNAAGVVGCRIIDSPRERMLAILTNNFVPCNGRFPAIITILTVFFAMGSGLGASVLSAVLLTAVILLGVGMTFLATYLLSRTLLRGEPSSFTLELPSYRKPQIGKVIVRSLFDRTLFVLGRSAAVAAPAGLIIWLLANIKIGGVSLLSDIAGFIDPVGRLMGLDGPILLGFALGFPANEIVLPITLMTYLAEGSLPELGGIEALRSILLSNGWCARTAVCFVLFSLMHWPCSTTLLTVKKETGSMRWTLLAAIIPSLAGFLVTVFVASLWSLLA